MNIHGPTEYGDSPEKKKAMRKLLEDSRPAYCSLRELIEDELRDLWQWGYDREPREESVRPRLDAIMRMIQTEQEQCAAIKEAIERDSEAHMRSAHT